MGCKRTCKKFLLVWQVKTLLSWCIHCVSPLYDRMHVQLKNGGSHVNEWVSRTENNFQSFQELSALIVYFTLLSFQGHAIHFHDCSREGKFVYNL